MYDPLPGDGRSEPTIGYGHLVQQGEIFPETGISKEFAEELLKKDLAKAETCVNKTVRVRLTQSMFDALVSLVFNIGCGRFMTSTLRKNLNKGDYVGASKQILRWIYAGGVQLEGLRARRREEEALFWEDKS